MAAELPAALPTSRCARCGGGFHCGAHDERPCACASLSLDAALLAELRRRYSGCLCLACLRELGQAHRAARGSDAA